MTLMSRIRQAAQNLECLSFAYDGGDASELISLVRALGERENCTIDYTVTPSSPGVITVQFMPKNVA